VALTLAAFASLAAAGGCSGGTAEATTAAATYRISGAVGGATAEGVTVALTGTASAVTTTSATGDYAFDGLANGSYTVTPSRNGFTFSPVSQLAAVNGADVTGRDFTASAAVTTHAISGAVSGATAEGVTMTLGGTASGTTATASDGRYVFAGLADGTYTVTPSLDGFTFSPVDRTVVVNGANATGRDFVASTSASVAPVLDPGFPRCGTIPGQTVASTTLTFTTGGPRHLVVATAWYAFETDPFPLTVAWVGGTPAGATAWTRRTWPNDGTIHWTAQIFTATATAPLSAQQVRITRPNATDYVDALSCVYSFAGASGFAAATDHHSPMEDVGQSIFVPADVTVQATAASSVLVGVLAAGEIDENHLGVGGHVTPRAGTTIDLDHVVAGSGQAAFRMTAPTAGPGSYTIGITNLNRAYAVEAIEVLAQ
jgi:hypothetical protein